MKKYIISISAIIIVGITSLVVYFSLPKSDPAILDLKTKNISVSIGEFAKVDCYPTIKNAVVTMKIDNSKVAKLENTENGSFVVGCSEGETFLILLARYQNASIEKKVSVCVLNKKEDSANNENSENENGSTDDADGGDASSVELNFSNLMNCTLENNYFIMNLEKSAVFSVNSNININKENFSVMSTSSDLTLTLVPGVGNNTYMLKAKNAGVFEICFSINQYHISYKIVVE